MRRLKILLKYIVIIGPIFYLQAVQSDTILTRNGATLVGIIKGTTKELVTMQTEYAGTITIDSGQITSIKTDSNAAIVVNDEGLPANDETQITQVTDNIKAIEHPWKYSIAANMNGKQGNVATMGTSFQAEALRAGDDDKIKLYASIDHAEVNDKKTMDEKIAGASYVTYIYNSWGWFMSAELEQDPFEDIDLRASVSGGLSYRILNETNHSLEIRTGVGYRHETFLDETIDNSPTLDFGLNHEWTFKPFPKINPWLEMSNLLSFTPSIKDFHDYLMMQDSGINMPIGNSKLKMRLGVKNNYNSQPVPGREELDTTYYSRLLLDFN